MRDVNQMPTGISIDEIEGHTVEFYAGLLNVNPKTLYREIQRGHLKCIRVGRAIRVTHEQFAAYIGGDC